MFQAGDGRFGVLVPWRLYLDFMKMLQITSYIRGSHPGVR